MMKNIVWEIEWTGSYPCLCFGEWIVKYDGKEYQLPEDVKERNMNTYGTYQTWHFDDDGIEEFEDYNDGLEFDEWIEENEWVIKWFIENHLPLDELEKFYNAIHEQDWRHNSCGGCI